MNNPQGGIQSVRDTFNPAEYEFTFEKTYIDLGRVRRGETRSFDLIFTNTGKKQMGIDLVSSCECTTATWAEGKRYAPGEKGKIHIVFDSTEKTASETVDIDVVTDVTNPKTGGPIFYILQYNFDLIH